LDGYSKVEELVEEKRGVLKKLKQGDGVGDGNDSPQ